jgi:hypothetical protein
VEERRIDRCLHDDAVARITEGVDQLVESIDDVGHLDNPVGLAGKAMPALLPGTDGLIIGRHRGVIAVDGKIGRRVQCLADFRRRLEIHIGDREGKTQALSGLSGWLSGCHLAAPIWRRDRGCRNHRCSSRISPLGRHGFGLAFAKGYASSGVLSTINKFDTI